jgi:hypothetical protein
MISSEDFDHFLKHGFIKDINKGTSMNVLINKFGKDYWYINDFFNGQNYGIIKIGFIEFHIAEDKISGISYRPDISFSTNDFAGVTIPWIYECREIEKVEEELRKRDIKYKKFVVNSSVKKVDTAGGTILFDQSINYDTAFIDTEGGVTFEFKPEKSSLFAFRIAKYYQ